MSSSPPRSTPIQMVVRPATQRELPEMASTPPRRRASKPWTDVDLDDGLYQHHLPPPDVYSQLSSSPAARVITLPQDMLPAGMYGSSPSKVAKRDLMKHPMFLTPVNISTKEKKKYVRIEPFIRTGSDEELDGVFLREDQLVELGLEKVGERDTIYGRLDEYGPVYMHLYTRHTKIPRCYRLPDAFCEHPKYHGGIVGIHSLWKCGLAVIVESGEIFLQDSDATEFQAKGEFGFN